ncbi:response regulator transcription factor [Frankia sp. Cas4]|uniref:response regulator transcription factor n=1 Tax=Frankia sp. Cas4 TaxID=3073927 RepID=UPI002AD5369D|nr:response regulator transcription factor [Frankia sp. Cas4]
MIRVLIADDQPLIRLGLRVLIETEDDLELVGEADDGRAALDLVRRARPDVALLDIRMPVLDGLSALRAITEDPDLAHTRVVMVTTFELDEYVFEALRSGASGFVLKDAAPADLLRAIRVVAAGESLLSPTVTRRVIEAFARRPVPASAPDLSSLTAREREVMGLVGRGLSNEEIAAQLVISPATARTHVSRVMVKLAARDRAQLAVLANQAGLVDT